MTEEVNPSVEEQSSQAVAQPTETEPVQEVRDQAAAEIKQRNDVAYNWAEANRKMKELERKAHEQDELIRRLQPQQAPSPPQEEDDLGIADDALAEGKHLKELRKEIKQLKSYIKEKEVSTVDERLSLKFPDFAEVVTKENIELLKQTEPELALSLYHTPDPYSQGISAYKLLKKVGVAKQDVSAPEKKRAQENSSKPVSVNALPKNNSAIGNAHLFENGLTPELKKSLYEEMKQAAKYA